MENTTIRVLQLTDLHLLGDKSSYFLKINTFDTLQAVLQDIKNRSLIAGANIPLHPDILVVSGDISQDYSIDSYELAKTITASFNCPTFIIPGNHDEPKLFKNFLNSSKNISTDKKINCNNWRLIFLNTQIPGKVAGSINCDEMSFLEEQLEADEITPTLIFLHHHVLPIDCAWLNVINLLNYKDFLDRIEKKKNIKLVVCGHIHQEVEAMYSNIHFVATPSTCFQFKTNSAKFRLDALMPGYRWFELNSDGTYATKVIRVDYDEKFVPDINNQEGY